MLTQVNEVHGRGAILAALGDHPYVRLNTSGGADGGRPPVGYLAGDATVWTSARPDGPIGYAMGEPGAAARLVRDLLATGRLEPDGWLHLPRTPPATLAAYLPVRRYEDWDFRWTATPPPVQPGEQRVTPLPDSAAAAVTELIDRWFPTSMIRPGDGRVRRWYGIRADGRLVACAADCTRGGTGFLAGITVAGDRRGRGLGAALTAALTRRLLDEVEEVTLGVLTDNLGAIRLYQRLGYLGRLPRTSVALHRPAAISALDGPPGAFDGPPGAPCG